MKIPAPRFQLKCTLGQQTAHLRDSLLERDDTIVLPRPLTREDFDTLIPDVIHSLLAAGLGGPEDMVLSMLFKANGDYNANGQHPR